MMICVPHMIAVTPMAIAVDIDIENRTLVALCRNWILESAGPWHQLARGTKIAPLPANVLASCSARFFVGIPEIERRLALSCPMQKRARH
jgi:hypothetical protein